MTTLAQARRLVGREVVLPEHYSAWVKGGLSGVVVSAGREQGGVCLRVNLPQRWKFARLWATDIGLASWPDDHRRG